ncbi:MAG: hypothetical protein CFH18_00716 [Alphaproteobacteria bacterium MarineAlpha5_Bin8]|nr:MAG: hypothetical protein CFH17_00335 [Alphaproteobacteria bacterium MarineAlpha5_Bin7]PPR46117.1 MAG: hypothetical protein CFH18_00716 [Alphaproteobacteria bacterium MarineAlpha5_Bin8]PPR53154.1 MAG: hypothetical protein CFH16_01151 [Alphaproteobacteria bacterium MarineAlpha5_Bin6]|tara:strand:+ start:548 stop:1075 length:528 start_codon:yes stop_codon:yes gene_type:complete
MLLHYFKKKENKDKLVSAKLYKSIVKSTQIISNKSEYTIKSEFNSYFELMVILLFIIFFVYKKNKKNKLVNQELMNLFIIDIDHTLREKGIGDMSIGKYVKAYVKKIYYRISKLDRMILEEDYLNFNKYIKMINIQNNQDNQKNFSKYLFNTIIISVKFAKKEDISKFNITKFIN